MITSLPRLQAEEAALPDPIPDGSKGRILVAALRLFAKQGFHGTSIRAIGAELGLKAGNLYLYFESKEKLLAELVRLGHEAHHRRLRRALISGSADPIEQVKAIVRAHVRVHAEYPMLAYVANYEAHALSPELIEPSLVLRRESVAIFTEVVQRGIDQGIFHVSSIFLATTAISGMGMRVASWYRPDLGIDIAELAETYAQFAIRILQP
ncbi:TetR/AcrR family transcriptional regulator [Haliangium sp.]|uniref:TetR/AcrR family transcriptional regulator n=1 Tax=Haliangium sp. TaxID=2663208 RepID=UPI003D13F8DC